MTDSAPDTHEPSKATDLPVTAAHDAQEGAMTTATLEVDNDPIEVTPRRVLLVTVGVLLPASFADADIEDITPTAIRVVGYDDTELTDFIQTSVQEARLVMT